MVLSAKSMQQVQSLSATDKVLVENLIDRLSSERQKKRSIGFWGRIGLLSFKRPEWTRRESSMTDDEIDDLIQAVRYGKNRY